MYQLSICPHIIIYISYSYLSSLCLLSSIYYVCLLLIIYLSSKHLSSPCSLSLLTLPSFSGHTVAGTASSFPLLLTPTPLELYAVLLSQTESKTQTDLIVIFRQHMFHHTQKSSKHFVWWKEAAQNPFSKQ